VGVLSQVLNLNLLTSSVSAMVSESIANRPPMQFRGPCPKARNAMGCRAALNKEKMRAIKCHVYPDNCDVIEFPLLSQEPLKPRTVVKTQTQLGRTWILA
jgi:hypothetical protein